MAESPGSHYPFLTTTQRACPGCLEDRRCWVCLGTGRADVERRIGTCGRCEGSGTCHVCASRAPALPAQRVPHRED